MSELHGGMASPTGRGSVQEKLDLLQEDAGVGKDEAGQSNEDGGKERTCRSVDSSLSAHA